jgi:hypothetical protein
MRLVGPSGPDPATTDAIINRGRSDGIADGIPAGQAGSDPSYSLQAGLNGRLPSIGSDYQLDYQGGYQNGFPVGYQQGRAAVGAAPSGSSATAGTGTGTTSTGTGSGAPSSSSLIEDTAGGVAYSGMDSGGSWWSNLSTLQKGAIGVAALGAVFGVVALMSKKKKSSTRVVRF